MAKTFRQIEAEDAATFFNVDELGRPITYTTEGGEEVATTATRTLGDMQNPGGFGGQAPRTAIYDVLASAVPDPQPMELIQDGTEKWRVTDVLNGSEVSWRLRCELISRVRG